MKNNVLNYLASAVYFLFTLGSLVYGLNVLLDKSNSYKIVSVLILTIISILILLLFGFIHFKLARRSSDMVVSKTESIFTPLSFLTIILISIGVFGMNACYGESCLGFAYINLLSMGMVFLNMIFGINLISNFKKRYILLIIFVFIFLFIYLLKKHILYI